MNKTIIDILKGFYIKIASIAIKANLEDITREQSTELLRDLMENTAAEIQRLKIAGFVTDN